MGKFGKQKVTFCIKTANMALSEMSRKIETRAIIQK